MSTVLDTALKQASLARWAQAQALDAAAGIGGPPTILLHLPDGPNVPGRPRRFEAAEALRGPFADGVTSADLGIGWYLARSQRDLAAALEELAELRGKLAIANSAIAPLSKPTLAPNLSYAWRSVSELGPGPVLCGYIFDDGDADTEPSLDLRQVFVGARNVTRALADELHERMAEQLLADCRAQFVAESQPW